MVSILKGILIIFANIFFTTLSKDCGNKSSNIISLPLFELEQIPCMYSGLVDLDKGQDTQMFYWLIHAENRTETTPLVVWLNGGPGSSSLFGLFTEMGPLRIKLEGQNLNTSIDLNNSWTRVANILFVDQPIGTGYSFSKNISDIPTNQTEVARQFYIFIQKFFLEHKELLNNNFYMTGESYAGKFIPHISKYILDMNQKIKTGGEKNFSTINLKKILIGNGLFDPSIQRESRRDFVMGINMLSENDDDIHLKYLSSKCGLEIANKDKNTYDTCQGILNFIQNMSGDVFVYDIRKNGDNDKLVVDAMTSYLNQINVSLNLHIPDGLDRKWIMRSEPVKKALQDDGVFQESKTTLQSLLSEYNLPVILIGGQFDLADGPQGIEKMIYSMNYSGIEEFRKQPRILWKIKKDNSSVDVVGYVKQKGKLIFITVRNSGHFFPRDQFILSLNVLQNLIQENHEIPCVDNNCDLIKFKCGMLGGCNGGLCDSTTKGLCKCKENNYGPDCNMTVTKLEDDSKVELNPRETKLFEMTIKNNFILNVEIDDNYNYNDLVLSMIPKVNHQLVNNFDKHPIKLNMVSKDSNFHLSDEHSNYFFIFHNSNSQNQGKIRFYLHFREIKKFWTYDSFVFLIGFLFFISGLIVLIVSYLLFRKYRQYKVNGLLEINNTENSKAENVNTA